MNLFLIRHAESVNNRIAESTDYDTFVGTRSYPGLARADYEHRFPGVRLPPEITDSGWWRGGYEEIEESQQRAAAVAQRLNALAAAEPETHLAFVSHGTFLNYLVKHLLGVPLAAPMYFFHANTGITRIEFARDGFRLLRYSNRIAHLPPALMTR